MRHASCLRQDDNPNIIENFRRFEVTLLYIASIKKDSDLLPGFCCGLDYLQKEINAEVLRACQNTAGQEAVDFIIDIVESNLKDISDLFCTRFNYEGECLGRFKHVMNDIKNVTTIPVDYDIDTLSVIQPLVDMAERMTQV